ncbi:hypothetical protein RFI_10321 [Reticulomyxa filosa]|uniref:Transmembrane protein n=1 Tax=Reticulomyxa filosa TaxID=46433 RepID=X6NN40_RETFI|nr:hypothetical protein RFI_10321 [Reticulomyxa filosa]|eukprot:ETO26812.1 hypothetical protein RFI_10321 [Reticulomyxa filosa]
MLNIQTMKWKQQAQKEKDVALVPEKNKTFLIYYILLKKVLNLVTRGDAQNDDHEYQNDEHEYYNDGNEFYNDGNEHHDDDYFVFTTDVCLLFKGWKVNENWKWWLSAFFLIFLCFLRQVWREVEN